jgi:tripartite-type tricarboxylate transporter receptor subunit TctC
MTLSRRTLIKTAAATTAAAALPIPAIAQGAWPQKDRTIKVIVPWPPGAANDALGRLLAERLQTRYGVTSVVENRVGGAGLVGTKAVVQSDPDGYTFLASAFNTAVMPLVLKAASDFNPETDLDVLARTAVAPLVCVMSAGLPQKTLPEVLAAAKAEPAKWNFAISSLGSAGHLATIEFIRRTGVNIQMVPYRGTQPALQDLMGGNIQLLIDPSFALLPAALDGSKVRALGIATKERSVLAPSVQTMAEAGLPGFEFNSWYGVWAPKNTPKDIAEKVNALVQETMKDPAVVAKLQGTLIVPVAESSDATRKFIRSEIVRAGELLKSVNFQPA